MGLGYFGMPHILLASIMIILVSLVTKEPEKEVLTVFDEITQTSTK